MENGRFFNQSLRRNLTINQNVEIFPNMLQNVIYFFKCVFFSKCDSFLCDIFFSICDIFSSLRLIVTCGIVFKKYIFLRSEDYFGEDRLGGVHKERAHLITVYKDIY